MKGRKGIIILPKNSRGKCLLSYTVSINKTISFVDDFTTIKNAHERAFIKNLTIKQYLHNSDEKFKDDFLGQINDGDGTTFLICKN